MWGWFAGLAHTLPYDVAVCGPGMMLPADRLAAIRVPTLALTGSNSPDWLQASTRAVADAVPGAQGAIVEGQDHGVLQQPDALRSILTEFFR
jgi:pimeloyl-ACP methyl ester carboxylesterase